MAPRAVPLLPTYSQSSTSYHKGRKSRRRPSWIYRLCASLFLVMVLACIVLPLVYKSSIAPAPRSSEDKATTETSLDKSPAVPYDDIIEVKGSLITPEDYTHKIDDSSDDGGQESEAFHSAKQQLQRSKLIRRPVHGRGEADPNLVTVPEPLKLHSTHKDTESARQHLIGAQTLGHAYTPSEHAGGSHEQGDVPAADDTEGMHATKGTLTLDVPPHNQEGSGPSPPPVAAILAPVLSPQATPVLSPQAKNNEPHSVGPLASRNAHLLEGNLHQSEHAPVLSPNVQLQDQGDGSKVLPPPTVSHNTTVAAPNLWKPAGLYTLSAKDIDGHEQSLSMYAGNVTVVVNVASACGFTDVNYKGLMKTYEKYRKFGFQVLGFPCNQFGEQESGDESHIKDFCTTKYHVTFPMFSKVEVNGPNTHPVYRYLKRETPISEGGGGGSGDGRDIGWNFYKFIVDRQGKPVRLLNQEFNPSDIELAIYKLLHEGVPHS